jgi:hypothetical protein
MIGARTRVASAKPNKIQVYDAELKVNRDLDNITPSMAIDAKLD